MKNIKYKVGLVGAGYISQFHIKALKRLPQVQFAGISDMDRERSREIAARYNVKVYSGLDSMKEDGVGCLHILTPPDSHAQIAVKALELGFHIVYRKAARY